MFCCCSSSYVLKKALVTFNHLFPYYIINNQFFFREISSCNSLVRKTNTTGLVNSRCKSRGTSLIKYTPNSISKYNIKKSRKILSSRHLCAIHNIYSIRFTTLSSLLLVGKDPSFPSLL